MFKSLWYFVVTDLQSAVMLTYMSCYRTLLKSSQNSWIKVPINTVSLLYQKITFTCQWIACKFLHLHLHRRPFYASNSWINWMVIYLAPRYEENLCTPAITHCKVMSSFIISDAVFAQSRNCAMRRLHHNKCMYRH